jgi:hypothetical protein
MPLKIKLVDLIENKKIINPDVMDTTPLYGNYVFYYHNLSYSEIAKLKSCHFSNSKLKYHLSISNATHEHYLWFTEEQVARLGKIDSSFFEIDNNKPD